MADIPKNDKELQALSDTDLESLRNALTSEADKLRKVRKVLAREAERRSALTGEMIAAAQKLNQTGQAQEA